MNETRKKEYVHSVISNFIEMFFVNDDEATYADININILRSNSTRHGRHLIYVDEKDVVDTALNNNDSRTIFVSNYVEGKVTNDE